MNFILASGSERRKELLSRIIDNYDIIVSKFNEAEVKLESDVSNYVKDIALGKAQDVSSRVSSDNIIIAADTIVTFNYEILGKPKDETDAFRMLKLLSGKWHKVYTSIVIINNSTNKTIKDVQLTEVKFSELTDDDILKYIKTGEPLDKAGAYGIQGLGGIFVEQIKGCYYNVVGMSLNKLSLMLKEICK